MANFATISDISAFLQVEISTAEQAAAAARALKEASDAIRNYCRQHLELVEDDEIVLDSKGGARLLLPELPVVAVDEVVEDGVTLTAGDEYKLGRHGILHRVGGAKWPKGVQVIAVTYTHGYATLPDIIVDIATRAASRAYQSGLRAAGDEGTLGVQSKALGDFSVAYASEGGGSSEGVMGASAARLLLYSEKEMLNEFRV